MSFSARKFGVIGGGAWGTALAQVLAQNSAQDDAPPQAVTLWAYESACVDAVNTRSENTPYLPGITLSPLITATQDLADLQDCDAVLVVTPAQHMRAVLAPFRDVARPGLPLVLCSKGIEIASLNFMSQIVDDILPDTVPAVLSGPSFAVDVARGLPTAVTLACADKAVGDALIKAIAAPTFRPYYSPDVLGAEIGGAVKNVLAIACGLVLGKGLGRSAHAAIISRGFAEMTRLGTALGCRPETLTGLCGLGDLVLTCSSEQSRNMSCGMALGQGQTLDAIMAERTGVTEGVATAPALKRLAYKAGVEMPICASVADILAGQESIDAAITRLLSRHHKSEG